MKQINVSFNLVVLDDYQEFEQGLLFLEDVNSYVYRVPRDSVITEEFLPGFFMLCDDDSHEVEWVDSPEDYRATSAVYRRVNVTFA